ncbi:MAG TPA: hypothetical protein VFJ00_03250 [Candidatus Limnocylindria bacterium]|nr:hypothetical protein [Candidatus Limnocylindria bacterium]
MNPGIKQYLDENGATYTPEALRKQLLDAGYDPGEVDAALSGWNAGDANGPGAEARRTFARWALWLHIAALLAVFVLLIALKGTNAIGTALWGCAVLAVALVIGWAISSLIGRALLPIGGSLVALIVPAISAIALGGSCFALLSSAIGTPPRQGTVSLELEAPRAFEGSGAANCYVGEGFVGIEVSSAQPLGTLDGREVTVHLTRYGDSTASEPGPAPETSVSVLFNPTNAADFPESYNTIFSTTFDVDVASDSLSGTITFDGLALEPGELTPTTAPPETVSGTVSWECE